MSGLEADQAHEHLHWIKSSHSGPDGGDCVEVAAVLGGVRVRVRDSKRVHGAVLTFSAAEWAQLTAPSRRG
ncbi:DUF397 domain-containing protein [Yinghuangia soli]|uniref:DUF397 domain-containing protein n=1 Tax=Yinghuangia soli TaxID=2908204 RepID=A0AA41Q5R0_9ACTN|nr:DUF397 domain-containing protein [Yinghuangia soli]MCF2532068.1 DUF397 domain-containing protein [Yinghuangia soli]